MDGGKRKMDKLKYDSGKARLALVPSAAIQAIGEIMTYGLTKYEESSWKNVEVWRYRDALMRHLCAYLDDPNGVDEESGYPHLWHLTTNAAFLCELEEKHLTQESEAVIFMMGDGKVQLEFKKGFADNIDISALKGSQKKGSQEKPAL
jgi:hypothetical protein